MCRSRLNLMAVLNRAVRSSELEAVSDWDAESESSCGCVLLACRDSDELTRS